jgi:hypothetical protein
MLTKEILKNTVIVPYDCWNCPLAALCGNDSCYGSGMTWENAISTWGDKPLVDEMVAILGA